MKKLLFIFILISSVLVNAQDFRNAKWRASLEEIKKSETAKLIKETDRVLMYSGNVNGKRTSIQYLFSDSGLYKINVNFNVKDSHDYSSIIDNHVKMISQFTEEYGRPKQSLANWLRLYVDSDKEKKKHIITHRVTKGMNSEMTWISEASKVELKLALSERKAPVHRIIFSSL